MPLDLRLIKTSGIRIYGSGIVTGQEIYNLNQLINRNIKINNKLKFMLWDLTNVTKIEMNRFDIIRYYRQAKEVSHLCQNIYDIMVAKENSIFGMLRMYEFYAEDLPVRTICFRDIDLAIDWLLSNLPEVKDDIGEALFQYCCY